MEPLMVLTLIALVVVLAVLGLGSVWLSRPAEHAPLGLVPPAVPPRESRSEYVTVRYVSKRGRVLGEQRIMRQSRRPSRLYRYAGRTGSFVAAHQASDGAWIYQHCHDERNAPGNQN
jgi:hypothetical protein